MKDVMEKELMEAVEAFNGTDYAKDSGIEIGEKDFDTLSVTFVEAVNGIVVEDEDELEKNLPEIVQRVFMGLVEPGEPEDDGVVEESEPEKSGEGIAEEPKTEKSKPESKKKIKAKSKNAPKKIEKGEKKSYPEVFVDLMKGGGGTKKELIERMNERSKGSPTYAKYVVGIFITLLLGLGYAEKDEQGIVKLV